MSYPVGSLFEISKDKIEKQIGIDFNNTLEFDGRDYVMAFKVSTTQLMLLGTKSALVVNSPINVDKLVSKGRVSLPSEIGVTSLKWGDFHE